jgi:hypothetical protein
MNHEYDLDCTHFGAVMNDVYVDCYMCGGTGTVVIDYTDEYEAQAGGDPVLPCAKCDGRGKLSRDLVNSERMKVIFWRILEHFG